MFFFDLGNKCLRIYPWEWGLGAGVGRFWSSIFSLSFVEVLLLWQEAAVWVQGLIIPEVALNSMLVILLKVLKGYNNLAFMWKEMFHSRFPEITMEATLMLQLALGSHRSGHTNLLYSWFNQYLCLNNSIP